MPTVACGVLLSSRYTAAEHGFKIVADGEHNIVFTRELLSSAVRASAATAAAAAAAAAITPCDVIVTWLAHGHTSRPMSCKCSRRWTKDLSQPHTICPTSGPVSLHKNGCQAQRSYNFFVTEHYSVNRHE